MHAASLATSRRLVRVLRVLKSARREFSSMELQQLAQVCAPGTCCSELRHNGVKVNCRRVGGAWFYSLEGVRVQLALA